MAQFVFSSELTLTREHIILFPNSTRPRRPFSLTGARFRTRRKITLPAVSCSHGHPRARYGKRIRSNAPLGTAHPPATRSARLLECIRSGRGCGCHPKHFLPILTGCRHSTVNRSILIVIGCGNANSCPQTIAVFCQWLLLCLPLAIARSQTRAALGRSARCFCYWLQVLQLNLLFAG